MTKPRSSSILLMSASIAGLPQIMQESGQLASRLERESIDAVEIAVLRHRIGLSYEAEAENVSREDIIGKILNTVEVPKKRSPVSGVVKPTRMLFGMVHRFSSHCNSATSPFKLAFTNKGDPGYRVTKGLRSNLK